MVVGLAAGVIASLAFARVLGNLLHGISTYDPLAFTSAGVVMLVTALIACWLPARRAAKVDPMVALRYE